MSDNVQCGSCHARAYVVETKHGRGADGESGGHPVPNVPVRSDTPARVIGIEYSFDTTWLLRLCRCNCSSWYTYEYQQPAIRVNFSFLAQQTPGQHPPYAAVGHHDPHRGGAGGPSFQSSPTSFDYSGFASHAQGELDAPKTDDETVRESPGVAQKSSETGLTQRKLRKLHVQSDGQMTPLSSFTAETSSWSVSCPTTVGGTKEPPDHETKPFARQAASASPPLAAAAAAAAVTTSCTRQYLTVPSADPGLPGRPPASLVSTTGQRRSTSRVARQFRFKNKRAYESYSWNYKYGACHYHKARRLKCPDDCDLSGKGSRASFTSSSKGSYVVV